MKLGLLPPGLPGAGGPSTYVTGVTRGMLEVSPSLRVRALLLGAKALVPGSRGERVRFGESLGPTGRVAVRARPLSTRLYRSRARALLPSYDVLFGRHDLYHQMHLDLDPAVPGDRLVVTLHDLVAERWPDEGRLMPGAADLLRRAAAVVTVSGASRGDILSRFPEVAPERVHVVWNGIDHQVFQPHDRDDESRVRALGIDGPYLVYVGGLTQRKNVPALLEAHALLRARRRDAPRLVLIGPWESRRIDAHAAPSAVLPLGPVPQEAVPALMRCSVAVVVPARDEGFGLPVLEAQACGSVVVCSDIPAFREIGGPAPMFAEPAPPESLALALEEAMDLSAPDRSRRIRLGLEHVAAFSWERSARGHLQVYRQVVG